MEKTINISLEQAKEYYKTTNDPAFKKLLEDNFGSELNDGYSWEDAYLKISKSNTYYPTTDGNIITEDEPDLHSGALDVPSKSKAKSLLALAQLIVIAEAYNKDRGEDYWDKKKLSKRHYTAYLTKDSELYFATRYNDKIGPLNFIESDDILKSFKKNKELWYDYLEVPDSQRN